VGGGGGKGQTGPRTTGTPWPGQLRVRYGIGRAHGRHAPDTCRFSERTCTTVALTKPHKRHLLLHCLFNME
jgi:hypothetical protein